MINALRYTEDLEKAGFSAEQAKASVKIWMDLMSDNFATRSDLKEHQFITRNDLRDHQQFFARELAKIDLRFNEVDQKIDKSVAGLNQKIDDRFAELDQKIFKLDLKFTKLFNELDGNMKLLESRLTIKLGSIMVIGIGLLGALKFV